MATEAQRKANEKYKEKQDIIKFQVPKGKKAEVEAFAKAKGFKSTTQFLVHLIDEAMKKED